MAPPLAWISLSSHGLHLRTTGFAEGNGELESSRKKKGVPVGYINRRNLGCTCPIRRLLENPGRTVFHLPSTRTASEIPSTPSVGRGVGLPLASRPPPGSRQTSSARARPRLHALNLEPQRPKPWVNVPLYACWRSLAGLLACCPTTPRSKRQTWPRASIVAAAASPRPCDCRLNLAPRRLEACRCRRKLPRAEAVHGSPLRASSGLPGHETNQHTACIRNPKTGSAHEGYGE